MGVEILDPQILPGGGRKSWPRVLIVAENASLCQGGESVLALQWFRGLLQNGVDAHLLVHARAKPELDQELAELSARIHYVPEVVFQTVFWKIGEALPPHVRSFTSGWVVHLITQFMQRCRIKYLIEQHEIEIVHQPTPVSPRIPSMMYGLGIPVVIGPMNGNMTYPPAYRHVQSFLERAFVPIGRGLARIANNIIPGKLHADMLLVANERTRLALPVGYKGKVAVLCENGVDPEIWKRPDDLPPRTDDALRLVFLGRLVDWKGVDVVLEILAQVKAQIPAASLLIIGDGPDLPRLKSQAKTLGLQNAVTFHGWAATAECPRLLSQTDILVFPSVFECGGAVILEAMALGIPVVALNWGGPSDYLSKGGGILIEPIGRQHTITKMTEAILGLTPEKRLELGKIAQQRVAAEYRWPAKIRQIIKLYRIVHKPYKVSSSRKV